MHGRGIITFADGTTFEGTTFEGEWKDGQLHGRQIATVSDGSKFKSEWKDKRNAEGDNVTVLSINGQPFSAESAPRKIIRKVGVGAGARAGAGEGKGESEKKEDEEDESDLDDLLNSEDDL